MKSRASAITLLFLMLSSMFIGVVLSAEDENVENGDVGEGEAGVAGNLQHVMILACEDAHVLSCVPNGNFGSDEMPTVGRVYYEPEYEYNYHFYYMKFNLLGKLPSNIIIRDFELEAYCLGATMYREGQIEVATAGCGWSEDTITWNNKPEPTPSSNSLWIDTSEGWRKWKLTSLVDWLIQWLTSNNYVTLVLIPDPDTSNDVYTWWYSRESTIQLMEGRIYIYYEEIPQNPPPPVADFAATPESGEIPLTVTFTDTSTGVITGMITSTVFTEEENIFHRVKNIF